MDYALQGLCEFQQFLAREQQEGMTAKCASLLNRKAAEKCSEQTCRDHANIFPWYQNK